MTVIEHNCPFCMCNKICLSWSDREYYVHLDDLNYIADLVLCAALDNVYDRGVPWGLSDERRNALTKLFEKHLSAVDSNWINQTISMDMITQRLFLNDILEVLKTIP